jgi:hypothetical protein
MGIPRGGQQVGVQDPAGRSQRAERRQSAFEGMDYSAGEEDEEEEGQGVLVEHGPFVPEVEDLLQLLNAQQQEISKLSSENDYLKKENNELSAEKSKLVAQVVSLKSAERFRSANEKTIPLFSLEMMKEKDSRVRVYTGFDKWDDLSGFLDVLEECGADRLTSRGEMRERKKKQKSLHWRESFLLTLMCIKCGFPEEHLAYLFNISSSYVSRLFRTRLAFLKTTLRGLYEFPSSEAISENSHPIFKNSSRYYDTALVLDGTEVGSEISSDHVIRAMSWSDYKSRHTAKWVVGLLPSLKVGWVSDCYGGSASDKHICEKEGVFDLLSAGQAVMVDKGFQIRDQLRAKGIGCHILPFLRQGSSFTEDECSQTREIAALRIHIERAIQRIKQYRWLAAPIPISQMDIAGDVFLVSAFLTNLLPSLVQSDEEQV